MKIRLSLENREFEIEGSEDFVTSHVSKLEDSLQIPPGKSTVQDVVHKQTTRSVPAPRKYRKLKLTKKAAFEDYTSLLKKILTDQMLLAGYHLQVRSANNSFSAAELVNFLRARNLKIENEMPWLLVLIRKEFKEIRKGHYKVTEKGIENINRWLEIGQRKVSGNPKV